MSDVLTTFGHLLKMELFILGGTQVSIKTILTVALILLLTYLVSRGIRRTIISVF